jgi:hypothetical protein
MPSERAPGRSSAASAPAASTNWPPHALGDLAAYIKVQTFDVFSEDNDPYAKHDFGSFEFAGEKCFWKISYYDKSLAYGSDDPADETRTTRVLTIMLASEYLTTSRFRDDAACSLPHVTPAMWCFRTMFLFLDRCFITRDEQPYKKSGDYAQCLFARVDMRRAAMSSRAGHTRVGDCP